jgi:hypothetical protein
MFEVIENLIPKTRRAAKTAALSSIPEKSSGTAYPQEFIA